MKNLKNGLSMIELLIGVVIFGLAMVPLMWMGTTQTRGAYSVGKHMMAGQIAASFLDSLLGLPYDECLEKVQKLTKSGKMKVLDNEELKETLQAVSNQGVEKDMQTSFRHFKYKFDFAHDEDKLILRLDIEVFYRVDEGVEKSEQSLKLSVLKHGARNG
ncbi:MAG: type IV pilus modification PilV family protein [Candidatus Rifleibacteriota bacterium]